MLIEACSTNPGKLRELAIAARQHNLQNLQIQPLRNLKEIQAPEENGRTFAENATLKAVYYSRFTSDIVLADDSGLEVAALNGEPGVYSARFAGPEATDEANNELLLRRMTDCIQRDARFVCVIALAQAGQVLTTATATVEGQILHEPRGHGGFGYDPLFFYPPFGCSFAELDPEQKFSVSHRGNALRRIFEWLALNNPGLRRP